MIKVLLLGSSGQIGSSLCSVLSSKYNLICPTREVLDLQKGKDISSFVRDTNPDLLINAAAYTNVDAAERNILIAQNLNSVLVQKLVEVANDLLIPLVHFSTDYVFDGNKDVNNFEPYTEEDKPNPLNVYGKTKLEGDLFVINNCNQYTIFRTSWLYGNGTNFPRTIHEVIAKIRKENLKKEISVVNDQFGSPTNSLDVANVVSQFMERGSVFNRKELYNLSSLGYCSWYDFACFITKVENISDIKVVPIKASQYISTAKRPKVSVLNCKKLLGKSLLLPTWEKAYEQNNYSWKSF